MANRSRGHGGGAGGAGGNVTATINIHPHPHQSPEEIGREAAGHVTQARDNGAELRSATYDWAA